MQEDAMWSMGIAEGIIAILFGISAVFWPGLTTLTLLYLFATFILISGLINLVAGIFNAGHGVGAWFMKVVLSVVQIGIGVYLLRHPHVSFSVFILLIGFGLIIRGVFEVVASFIESVSPGTRILAIIAGALALITGIVVLFQPVRSGVAFVWLLGIYALISGPILIATALDRRSLLHVLKG